jgi:PAS domain S-box-containing protein
MASVRDAEHSLSALRIVLLYAVFAGLWIYFSDTLLGVIVTNAESFVRVSVLKGFLFIAVTGTFLYFLITRNIRRIRSIGAALAESDARFRSYVEDAPLAIMVFDEDGRCIDYNPAAADLMGADPASMRRMRMTDIIPEGREIAVESASAAGEFERRGDDGRRVWVQLRTVRLEGRQFLFFCQDITERVTAEENLRETNERLVQAEKMEAVGRLAGGVAHDFNNILTAIYGYSDILLGITPPGQETRFFVTEIRKAAVRAASLTQQLLAFSRRQTLLPRAVDLNDLLRNLTPMLVRLIGEDVDVAFDLADGLWTVRVDPARVEQALVNLAVNARDAMPRGGRLALATRNVSAEDGSGREPPRENLEGEHVAISVADNGVGMDTAAQSHLFEPFYTTKEVGKGTGLGLATVYGIVKQSGGVIDVRSEPGKGSAFTMYFPRSTSEASPLETTAGTHVPAVEGHELILYVEDDEAVRGLMTLILENHGYEVLSASNGEEALRIARPTIGSIALVITDVVMPKMNGRELVERLKEMKGDLKFVYTSGYTNDTIAQHDILSSGAVLIEKPIDSEILLGKIREMLDAGRS